MAQLAMLGSVVFEVQPTNLESIHGEVGHDWAVKHVVGGMKPREAMGEADAKTTLIGKLFPQMFGAGGLDALKSMAESGSPQMYIGGAGAVMGWQCIEKVTEKHSYLDPNGQGRVIEFEVVMVASTSGASSGAMMDLLGGLFSAVDMAATVIGGVF